MAEQSVSTDLMAAIDLGSNSFHMLVAQLEQDEIRPLERLGEKVQLAAGLDKNNHLDETTIQRALACLQRFAQRLQGFAPHRVSVLATNALRVASNRQDFMLRAEAILGFPIEVIAGREEARLIYLGVAHTLADDDGNRLVIDIGGGSTEFIIGRRFEALELESLHMGCVTYTQRFFVDGQITEDAFRSAITAARRELLNIQANFKKLGWQHVVGSSGTAKALEQLAIANGLCEDGLSHDVLVGLKNLFLDFKTTESLDLPGLKVERRHILPAGLAILTAIFETFDISQLDYSEGALREGALYDLIGRDSHEDVRARTVKALFERFNIDRAQAQRVKDTALFLFSELKEDWQLDCSGQDLLVRAAELHELGLAISHSQFHKHGAYLLQHADLLGFTRQGQQSLATLVRTHRRKISLSLFAEIAPNKQPLLLRLAVILRLAVLLNLTRGGDQAPAIKIQVSAQNINLEFPLAWLEQHPLTLLNLQQESSLLTKVGLVLTFR